MTLPRNLLPVVLVIAIILPLQLTGCPRSTSESLPVINYFTASPSTICVGGAARLSWNVSRATTASIDQNIGNVPFIGQAIVGPDYTTIYQLTASNTAGTVTATIQVAIDISPPLISRFLADPEVVNPGCSSTLSWDLWNKCGRNTIDNGIGNVPYYGDEVVHPDKTTIYTLMASNASGNVTATVQVTVPGAPLPFTYPPVLSFYAATYTNQTYGISFQYPIEWVERPELLDNPERVAAFGENDFVPNVIFEVIDSPGPETIDGIHAWLGARGYKDHKVLSDINRETLADTPGDGTPAYTYKVSFVSAQGYDIVAYLLEADKEHRRFRMMVWTVDVFSPYDEALFSEIAHTLRFISYQNPDEIQ